MLRRILAVAVILLAVTGLVWAGGGGEPAPTDTFNLKFSMTISPDVPEAIIVREIAELVKERTNGAVNIEVFYNNALGTESEVLDLVRAGAVAFAHTSTGFFNPFFEPIQAWSWPYMFESLEHVNNYLESESARRVWDIVENASGVKILVAWPVGDRHLTTKGIDVQTPIDLSGVKMRVMNAPVFVEAWKAIGADPVPIAYSELYFALQTGVAQAQEQSFASHYAPKLHEVQDRIILTSHQYMIGVAYASNEAWNQLPPEYQSIISDIFEEAKPMFAEIVAAKLAEFEEFFRDYGIKFIEPDRQAFIDAANEGWNRVYGNDPEWDRVFQEVKAARP